MIPPRPELSHLKSYRPGRPEGYVPQADTVNLAANENAWGPSRRVSEVLADSGNLARYPDMTGLALLERLAPSWRVDIAQLMLGTGSGHLIKCLAETYLQSGDAVAILDPTFSLYGQAARLMGAEVRPLPGNGESIRFVDYAAWIAEVSPRLVFLCNPNNPTGDMASDHDFQAIVEALPSQALLVVDEAYVEFARHPADSLSWVRRRAPVAVLRTFSKVYGLAALRLGVLIADAGLIELVGRVREPFPVSSLSIRAGLAALDDRDHVEHVIQNVADGRQHLQQQLQERGWTVNPSEANFVWARPPEPWSADRLVEALRDQGILIRAGSGFGQSSYVRITVGTPHEMDRFFDGLAKAQEDRCGS